MAAELNPAQSLAVQTLSGPLLVLAGAGSGKTRVVTHRIAELIRHGVAPDRILAVTFTNKAAGEMQERVKALLGGRGKAKPLIATFHSLCVRVLRRHARLLGYPERFAIYDRGDQESLARQVLREIRVGDAALRPGDLLGHIGRWKTRGARPGDAATLAQTDVEHLAAAAYRRYQRALKMAGALDFDDLLLCAEDLFRDFPQARQAEAARFDHVLIDEYQDTNGSQYRIVTALVSAHGNLCVVGDDDQSIYRWRGAEVEHILRFERDWPSARVVRLEENYRSTARVLELANRLIAFNPQRHAKVLRATRPGGSPPRVEQCKDETAEARFVVQDIQRWLAQGGWEPRDFAILFRTNEQPRAFETELRKAKLPYVLIGGMSFFDRKEVKDALAYLRVIDAPRDEVSLLRVLNTPPRGLGDKSVEKLLAHAVAQGRPLWEAVRAPESVPDLGPAASAACREFAALIAKYRRRFAQAPLAETARQLLAEIRYEDELRRVYPDPQEQQARLGALEQVVSALAAHEQAAREEGPPAAGAVPAGSADGGLSTERVIPPESALESSSAAPTRLTSFLDETALGGREFDNEKDKQLRRNSIPLLTLHSAKGLEFPHVYLVGLEEGLLPHQRSVAEDGEALAEERRLCYVGVTRAQERLTLTLALTRMKWGKPRPSVPSRFLFEMTGMADQAAARPPARKR